MGIEPTWSAWKAEVLPLNYTRKFDRQINCIINLPICQQFFLNFSYKFLLGFIKVNATLPFSGNISST